MKFDPLSLIPKYLQVYEHHWTVDEIAEHLGVSTKTIRRMQAAGLMPPRFRSQHSYRYRDSDVQPWLRQRGA